MDQEDGKRESDHSSVSQKVPLLRTENVGIIKPFAEKAEVHHQKRQELKRVRCGFFLNFVLDAIALTVETNPQIRVPNLRLRKPQQFLMAMMMLMVFSVRPNLAQ